MRWIAVVLLLAGILGFPANFRSRPDLSAAAEATSTTTTRDSFRRFRAFSIPSVPRISSVFSRPRRQSAVRNFWETGEPRRSSMRTQSRELVLQDLRGSAGGSFPIHLPGTLQLRVRKCRGVSRFPVRDSMEAYNKGEIEFDRIAFKINAAVGATFDSRARVYAFELPYLYVPGRNGANSTYSMMPPNAAAKYAQEVTNRWECKRSRTRMLPTASCFAGPRSFRRNRAIRNQAEDGERGSSAYVLLTDGREARATFTLAFPTDARRAAALPPHVENCGSGTGGFPVAVCKRVLGIPDLLDGDSCGGAVCGCVDLRGHR